MPTDLGWPNEPNRPIDLRLLARDTCRACGGTGGVPSNDWQGFEAWADRRRLTDRERDDAVEEYFLDICGLVSVPAMNEPCEPCKSTGNVEVEVPVAQLLDLVFDRLDAPPIARAEVEELVETLKQTMTSAALRSPGLVDPFETGEWLRVCAEAAETLRVVGELRPRRSIE